MHATERSTQGSVHEFDTVTGAGSMLLDDGLRVSFTPEVFWASGLRLLRVGQRLTLRIEDGRVVDLRLLGV